VKRFIRFDAGIHKGYWLRFNKIGIDGFHREGNWKFYPVNPGRGFTHDVGLAVVLQNIYTQNPSLSKRLFEISRHFL